LRASLNLNGSKFALAGLPSVAAGGHKKIGLRQTRTVRLPLGSTETRLERIDSGQRSSACPAKGAEWVGGLLYLRLEPEKRACSVV